MTTVKDVAIEELRQSLIEIRSGISPLSQMDDDYKSQRETAMFEATIRAFDALTRLKSYS